MVPKPSEEKMTVKPEVRKLKEVEKVVL